MVPNLNNQNSHITWLRINANQTKLGCDTNHLMVRKEGSSD